MEPQYFLEPRQLYPLWPQWHPDKAQLFSTTIVLLFLPAAEHHPDLGQGRERVRWQVQGDPVDAAGDAVLHAAGAGADDFPHPFRPRAFLGWAATWNSPQRDDDSTPWSEAVKRHGPQTLLGFCGRCW
jgi:membrane glycosyltransferase